MFGHIAKKQAVSADLGPISKELIKIEKGIDELKNNDNIDLTPVNTKLDNNNKLVQQLWNSIIGDKTNLYNTIWGLYNLSVGDANSTYNVVQELYQKLINDEDSTDNILWRIYNQSIRDANSTYNVVQMLYQNLINNPENNNNNNNSTISTNGNDLIETFSISCIVRVSNIIMSSRQFLYTNFEIYNKYVIVNILNNYKLRVIDKDTRTLEILTTSDDYDIYNNFRNKYQTVLDISPEVDPERKEGFSFYLITQTLKGTTQSLWMEVRFLAGELYFQNLHIDADYDFECIIIPQKIILPCFKNISIN